MSNEFIQDGRNRCKRCNRPLSNPNASYGWWCAKLLGLDFYVEKDRNLDDDDLSVYNEDSKDNATYIMSAHHFDKIRYGENSKVFIALDNLKRAHEAFPEYKDAINIVDNEIRRIENKWGSERIETEIKSFDNTIAKFNKILSEEDKFNVSLSTVEQVLAVAHPMQAAYFDMARKKQISSPLKSMVKMAMAPIEPMHLSIFIGVLMPKKWWAKIMQGFLPMHMNLVGGMRTKMIRKA